MSSWVVLFGSTKSTSTNVDVAPAGFTARQDEAATGELASFDSNGAITDFVGVSEAYTGTATDWISISVAIVDTVPTLFVDSAQLSSGTSLRANATMINKWTPNNLVSVGLEGWYRLADPGGVMPLGNDLTRSGSNVTAWADRSGHARTLFKDGSTNIVYSATSFGGQPGITTDGNNSLRTTAGAGYPANTVVGAFVAGILSSSNAATSFNRLASFIVAGGQDVYSGSGVVPLMVNPDTNLNDVTYFYAFGWNQQIDGANTPALFEGYPISTTQATANVNGSVTPGAPIAISALTLDRFGLFGPAQGGPPGYFIGSAAEVVLVSGVLSTDDLQKLEGYLAWNNGLQAQLPPSHPYFSAAPVILGPGIVTVWTDTALTAPAAALSASLLTAIQRTTKSFVPASVLTTDLRVMRNSLAQFAPVASLQANLFGLRQTSALMAPAAALKAGTLGIITDIALFAPSAALGADTLVPTNMSYGQWNSTPASGAPTFSDDNHTTGDDGSYRVWTNRSHRNAGKWYIEFTAVTTFGGNDNICFGDLAVDNWVALWSFGQFEANFSIFGPQMHGPQAGDRIALAIDLDNQLIWYKNFTSGANPGVWNDDGTAHPPTADPAAGTGGASYAGLVTLADTVYAGFYTDNDTTITLNAGDAGFPPGTVPANYLSWFTPDPPSPFIWEGETAELLSAILSVPKLTMKQVAAFDAVVNAAIAAKATQINKAMSAMSSTSALLSAAGVAIPNSAALQSELLQSSRLAILLNSKAALSQSTALFADLTQPQVWTVTLEPNIALMAAWVFVAMSAQSGTAIAPTFSAGISSQLVADKAGMLPVPFMASVFVSVLAGAVGAAASVNQTAIAHISSLVRSGLAGATDMQGVETITQAARSGFQPVPILSAGLLARVPLAAQIAPLARLGIEVYIQPNVELFLHSETMLLVPGALQFMSTQNQQYHTETVMLARDLAQLMLLAHAGATSMWTPLNISSAGVEGWYRLADPHGIAADGSDLTLSGSNVTAWADQSGHGRDLTKDGSTNIVYSSTGLDGRPCITTDGNNELRTTAGQDYPTDAGFGAFVIGILSSSNAANSFNRLASFTFNSGGDVFADTGVIPLMVNPASNTNEIGYFYSFNSLLADIAADIPALFEGYPNSTTDAAVSVNATPISGDLAIPADLTVDQFGLFGPAQGGPPGLFTGSVSEVVLTSGVLSTDDLQKLEGYLAWNNDQQALLPSDHPYKTGAPVLNRRLIWTNELTLSSSTVHIMLPEISDLLAESNFGSLPPILLQSALSGPHAETGMQGSIQHGITLQALFRSGFVLRSTSHIDEVTTGAMHPAVFMDARLGQHRIIEFSGTITGQAYGNRIIAQGNLLIEDD